MNDWRDICLLTLSCVLANHMGLISAVEEVIKRKLPIIDCVKCSSFWSVLIFCLFSGLDVITSVAISFFSSYIAIWLELFFGFIDNCYEKIYNAIYKDSATSTQTDSDYKDTESTKDALP